MMYDPEKREYKRVRIKIHVVTRPTNVDLTVTGMTRDLSPKGIFVICDQQLDPGATCKVEFLVGVEPKVVRFQAKGVIRRSDDEGMAIEFTETAEVKKDLEKYLGIK